MPGLQLAGIRRRGDGWVEFGRLQPEHHLPLLWTSLRALPQYRDPRFPDGFPQVQAPIMPYFLNLWHLDLTPDYFPTA